MAVRRAPALLLKLPPLGDRRWRLPFAPSSPCNAAVGYTAFPAGSIQIRQEARGVEQIGSFTSKAAARAFARFSAHRPHRALPAGEGERRPVFNTAPRRRGGAYSCGRVPAPVLTAGNVYVRFHHWMSATFAVSGDGW